MKTGAGLHNIWCTWGKIFIQAIARSVAIKLAEDSLVVFSVEFLNTPTGTCCI